MITIMCSVWAKELAYLREFIRFHSRIGVDSFIFIVDEYVIPFGLEYPESDMLNVTYVKGVSFHSENVQRQEENYNFYLNQVKTDYLCVIDADEFLHPQTLDFCNRHQPQRMSLPWRMMAINHIDNISCNESLYAGFLVPQKKSISKVTDIDRIGIHECIFKKKGKTLGYQSCLHIPVNHFYVRDDQDVFNFLDYGSSHSRDPYFKKRFLVMTLISSMCSRFAEYQGYCRLSEKDQCPLPKEYCELVNKFIKSNSSQYLYVIVKIVIAASRFANVECILPIRAYPEIIKYFDACEYSWLKVFKMIMFLFRYFAVALRGQTPSLFEILRINR